MKIKIIASIIFITVVGTVSLLMVNPGKGVYEDYLSINDNKGYNSKSKFNKEFTYIQESKAAALQEETKDNTSNVDGTYLYGDKGPKVPLYLQGGDSPWADYAIPGFADKTIRGSGCGYTSLAMAITYLTGKEITPIDILETGVVKHTEDGMSWGTPPKIAAFYGLTCTETTSVDVALNEIKSGKIAVASCVPYDQNKNQIFTTGAHIVCIRGVTDDNKFLINNPNGNGPNQLNEEYDLPLIKTLLRKYFILGK